MNFEFRILNFEFALFSLENTHGFAEALEMYDLALTKEFNCIVYVGIVGKAKNSIVSGSRLLLC